MLTDNELLIKLVITVLVIVTFFVLRNVSLRFAQKKDYPSHEAKLRAMAYTRKTFLLLMLLAVCFIWLTQLRDFALSLTALAVAIVIATKELILCISGGALRSYSHSFRIGDRITVGEHRGDVVNIDMMTTTLMEIGPGASSHQYTGKSINLPNSIFLTLPVTNETFTDSYILHVFAIPVKAASDWKKAEKLLLSAADEVVAEYLDAARENMIKVGRKTGLEAPSVDPRITIVIQDPDTYSLLLRVPVPALRKGRIEQAIVRRYLESLTGNSPD